MRVSGGGFVYSFETAPAIFVIRNALRHSQSTFLLHFTRKIIFFDLDCMEDAFGDAFLGIDLNLMIFLHLVNSETPVHILLLLVLLGTGHGTAPLLHAKSLQNGQHHLLLLSLLQFPLFLSLPLLPVLSLVLPAQWNEHLLCLAVLDDLLDVQLGRGRRDLEGGGRFLPIFVNVLLKFDPVSHGDLLPLVDLLIAAGVQLFQIKDAALTELAFDGVEFDLIEDEFKQLIFLVDGGGGGSGGFGMGVVHGVHGLAEFLLLLLRLDLLPQSLQLVFLNHPLRTNFSASPSSTLQLCGRSSARLPFIYIQFQHQTHPPNHMVLKSSPALRKISVAVLQASRLLKLTALSLISRTQILMCLMRGKMLLQPGGEEKVTVRVCCGKAAREGNGFGVYLNLSWRHLPSLSSFTIFFLKSARAFSFSFNTSDISVLVSATSTCSSFFPSSSFSSFSSLSCLWVSLSFCFLMSLMALKKFLLIQILHAACLPSIISAGRMSDFPLGSPWAIPQKYATWVRYILITVRFIREY